MSFLRWAVSLFILILLLYFVVQNRQIVSLSWNPLSESLLLPLYLVILITLIFGFITGVIFHWLSTGPVRAEKKRLKKKLKALEKNANHDTI